MRQILILIVLSCILITCNANPNKLDTVLTVNENNYAIHLRMDVNKENGSNTRLTITFHKKVLLIDSIFCSQLRVLYKDMNSDGYDDLLLYQSSGTRANETYNLYLYDSKNYNFTRVEEFNDWPNMNTTELNNIIVSEILTGSIEYHFFELSESGKLIDLNIIEEDTLPGGQAYDKGLLRVKTLKADTAATQFSLTDNVFKKNSTLITYDILFDYDLARIRPESYFFLDSVVLFLEKNDGLTIEVGNHSDSRGSDMYSTCLTCKRADSVRAYIISKGIVPERITAKGYGESEPLLKEATTEEEHQKNRRTEFKIIAIKE